MIVVPPMPPLPEKHRAKARAIPRYDDVTQDGRLAIRTMANVAGPALWETVLTKHPFYGAMRVTGVLPVLTRIVMEGGEGPFSVMQAVYTDSGFDMAHSVDEKGEVSRIHMRMWIDVSGPIDPARTAAERRHAILFGGRAYLEHVFTRLLAPPDQRRVTQVSWPGEPSVPFTRHEVLPPEEAWVVPSDAEPLEPDFVRYPTATVFGLTHTDANQHVNSLVYPRLFEEASLLHLHTHFVRAPLLARGLEIAYRKPCFAGEAMRIYLRAWHWRGQFLVTGYFVADAATEAKDLRPRVYVQMRFTE